MNAGERPRIRVGVVVVRLAAGLYGLGRTAAHPRPDFWLSSLLCDFAFTATSFFAGAEKRKQKLRFWCERGGSGPKSP
jgi:hypothetical protein